MIFFIIWKSGKGKGKKMRNLTLSNFFNMVVAITQSWPTNLRKRRWLHTQVEQFSGRNKKKSLQSRPKCFRNSKKHPIRRGYFGNTKPVAVSF